MAAVTLMLTSRNRSDDYLAAFTMSSFGNRCFCMPLQQVRVNMTMPFAECIGNHCQNEIWGWNPLPLSSLVLNPHAKILRTCTGTCTNCGGSLEEANMKRLLRSTSIKKCWNL